MPRLRSIVLTGRILHKEVAYTMFDEIKEGLEEARVKFEDLRRYL